jgi:phosphopantothenoylcysteine decarboxylase/phosphopantothenate--cysteine ligase
VLVAPAMNNHMWDNAATQDNVETLRSRGITIIEPGTGDLATKNEWGAGRLAEPPELLAAVEAIVPAGPRAWDGLKVLVTAGGTREPIDAVRYVGNRSSGRMGVALAAEAAALGAQVTLIAANVAVAVPASLRRIDVSTAAELAAACDAEFAQADVLLMAAAVADFRPADPAAEKLKKADRTELTIKLERTTDVLSNLASKRRSGQTIVGFAAETGSGGLAHARGKLVGKGVDAVVLNDVARPEIGFDSDDNEVTIVTAEGERAVELASKRAVAREVLQTVSDLRSQPQRVS